MEIFVEMPDDTPTIWDTDFVGLPDPLFPWHEEFEDSLINGQLTTVDTYIYPAQEFERCVSIRWEDTWQNHWDTLTVELLTDNTDIFGLGNDPSFTDTTVWYRPSLPSDLKIQNELCWIPECEQIREEPYRFTLKLPPRPVT